MSIIGGWSPSRTFLIVEIKSGSGCVALRLLRSCYLIYKSHTIITVGHIQKFLKNKQLHLSPSNEYSLFCPNNTDEARS